jgi:hypothetical protein
VQLPAGSIDQHTNYLRALATQFAGETGLPLSSLGIVQDNPSSADAMKTARDDLVIEAQTLNTSNSLGLEKLAHMILALKSNVSVFGLSYAERQVKPKFLNPAMPSSVARADTIVKLISAFPFLADTNLALTEAGFDMDQVRELESERKRTNAQGVMESLQVSVNENEATAPAKTEVIEYENLEKEEE